MLASEIRYLICRCHIETHVSESKVKVHVIIGHLNVRASSVDSSHSTAGQCRCVEVTQATKMSSYDFELNDGGQFSLFRAKLFTIVDYS